MFSGRTIHIDNVYDKCFHIIVLDDFMEKIVKSADIQELFTKYCYHKNVTTIMVSLNVFQKGLNAHTISFNMHIHILMQTRGMSCKSVSLPISSFIPREKRDVFSMSTMST